MTNEMATAEAGVARLVHVALADTQPTRTSPMIEADRAQAVADLAAENHFAPAGLQAGPYGLILSSQMGRLVFDIRGADGTPLLAVGLALGPFHTLVKDYALLMASYAEAAEEGRGERIETIDMGRRSLHNEGAALVMERLRGKIDIDFATARRLFTLICVLLQRG